MSGIPQQENGKAIVMPNIFQEYRKLATSVLKARNNLTKEQFFGLCGDRVQENGQSTHYFLLKTCHDAVAEKEAFLASKLSLNSITQFFDDIKADLNSFLYQAVVNVRENMDYASLKVHLQHHTGSLCDEIHSSVLAKEILSKKNISDVFDNIRRFESIIQNFSFSDENSEDCPWVTDAFLEKMDVKLSRTLANDFMDLHEELFNDERTGSFQLLANKLEICLHTAAAGRIFPNSLNYLSFLQKGIECAATEKVKSIEETATIAMESRQYEQLACLLVKLKTGIAQTCSLLPDFDSLRRAYWDILGASKKCVDDITATLLHEVYPSPLADSDFDAIISQTFDCEATHKQKWGEFLKRDMIKKLMLESGLTNKLGYCLFFHEDGAHNSLLDPYAKGIEYMLQGQASECNKKIKCMDNNIISQITTLPSFDWLDSFAENSISETSLSVAETLQMLKNLVLWRLNGLQGEVSSMLCAEEVKHMSIFRKYDIVQKLLNLSSALELHIDKSKMLYDLNMHVRHCTFDITNTCVNLEDLRSENFPFEKFEEFFSLKQNFENIIVGLGAESDLMQKLTSTEYKIRKSLQRLISDQVSHNEVLEMDADTLKAVLSWEDHMLRRAPSLQNYVPELNNYILDQETVIPLRSAVKLALSKLIRNIEQLLSAATDFEQVENNILQLERFIPLDEYCDENIPAKYSFLCGQQVTMQSSVHQEYKENVANFTFSGLRDYLDKCNEPSNTSLYKRYTELMDIISGVVKNNLKTMQTCIPDGEAMQESLTKLRRARTDIGGDMNSYDHLREYSNIDLDAEIDNLLRQCNEYIDSQLPLIQCDVKSHTHKLEVAVKTADTLLAYCNHVDIPRLEKIIGGFIENIKGFLSWNGQDKPTEGSLAFQLVNLVNALLSQQSREGIEGALSVTGLTNILDQMKHLQGVITSFTFRECINYDFWRRQVLILFKEAFDYVEDYAEKCGTYSTAVSTLKLMAANLSESFFIHVSNHELKLSERIVDMERRLEKFNKQKNSAFQSEKSCQKLKRRLDNMKIDICTSHCIFFEGFEHSQVKHLYLDTVRYYQGRVDILYSDLVKALNDNNIDMVTSKLRALECVNKILYLHLNARLDEVDHVVLSRFQEMIDNLMVSLDAKDITGFKHHFQGFYFYRKILQNGHIPLHEHCFHRLAALHRALIDVINSSKTDFLDMCSNLKFDNALNIVDSVKSCRSFLDSEKTQDYCLLFQNVYYFMKKSNYAKTSSYTRNTRTDFDTSIRELYRVCKSFPTLTELSTTVYNLHTTILESVEVSVLNHEFFKLRSISEGLRSFHLLSDFGGGKDLIDETRRSVHNTIRGSLDGLRQDVTHHWTQKNWAHLNDAIKLLHEADEELKHFSGLIDTSLMYDIQNELERKLTDIGSRAIDIAMSSTGDNVERIRDFAINLTELGRIYDQVQVFHSIAKANINRVLNHCRQQCGLHFIFRLGVILEEGAVFDDENDDVRIGRRLVSDFTHFKDVATMSWIKRVAQIPVNESLKNMKTFTYNSAKKQRTLLKFDCHQLKKMYDEYNEKYEQLVVRYLPEGMDMEEIVEDVLQLASPIKSCGLSNWNDSVKSFIPFLLAGIFAYYTVSKSGDSFNSIGASEDENGITIDAKEILITPHSIQVLTILRLLGCADSEDTLKNHLMQIGTGEGKSIVLGALATLFGVLDYPVRCVCYSEYLSSRDFNDFKDIFVAFKCQNRITYSKITAFSEHSVSQEGNIRKLTQRMILEKYSTTDTFEGDEETKWDGQQNSDKEILLVDEVDVFFGKDFYGQTYNQVTPVSTPEIVSLIKMIWKERSSRPNLSTISTHLSYKKLVQRLKSWKFLIDNELKLMCAQVNMFNKPPYTYNQQKDKIGYSEHDTISYSLTYGYRTLFAYLNELDKGNVKPEHAEKFEKRHIHMLVSCGQFSYANINPACILGVSGTLDALTDYEREVMTRYNISTYSISPSVYGTKCLVFDAADSGIRIANTKADYFKAIVDSINEISRSKDVARKKHRAAIVFFESIERLIEFRQSEFFRQVIDNTSVNLLLENTPKEARDYIVKKAATAEQVTLSTKVFGRGTDFTSNDTELNDRGGTHIVQTFLSEMLTEQLQIMGRTSRQGQKGSYSMILLAEDELVPALGSEKNMVSRHDTLAHFNIQLNEINKKSYANRYKFLGDKRNEKRKSEVALTEENLLKATERDKATRAYFKELLRGRNKKAALRFENIYMSFKGVSGSCQQVGIHVIFMLDESGSMAGSKYDELRQAYHTFVSKRLQKNGTGQDVMTVITFSCSARVICQMVPLASAPELPYNDGRTNFCPPLSAAKDILRNSAGSGLSPVLVLMTDGCCTDINAATQMMSSINDKHEKDGLQAHFVAFGSGASISNLECLSQVCADGKIHTAEIGDLSEKFQEIEESIAIAEYN